MNSGLLNRLPGRKLRVAGWVKKEGASVAGGPNGGETRHAAILGSSEEIKEGKKRKEKGASWPAGS